MRSLTCLTLASIFTFLAVAPRARGSEFQILDSLASRCGGAVKGYFFDLNIYASGDTTFPVMSGLGDQSEARSIQARYQGQHVAADFRIQHSRRSIRDRIRRYRGLGNGIPRMVPFYGVSQFKVRGKLTKFEVVETTDYSRLNVFTFEATENGDFASLSSFFAANRVQKVVDDVDSPYHGFVRYEADANTLYVRPDGRAVVVESFSPPLDYSGGPGWNAEIKLRLAP